MHYGSGKALKYGILMLVYLKGEIVTNRGNKFLLCIQISAYISVLKHSVVYVCYYLRLGKIIKYGITTIFGEKAFFDRDIYSTSM